MYQLSSMQKFLDPDLLLSSATVTVLRDGTDAADSISLVLHLIRTLSTAQKLKAQQVVIVTSRTRTSYSEPTLHVHPVVPRSVTHAFSSCRIVDPHPHFQPATPYRPADALDKLLSSMYNVIADDTFSFKPRVVVIECLHALRFSFAVDPSAFVRSLSALDPTVSVIMAAPIGCGIDGDLSSITTLAHNVIDLSDLRTGVATDIDGLIAVSKSNGRWISNPQHRRYKITDTSFSISSE